MNHICRGYLKHPECTTAASYAIELILSLENQMILLHMPGDIPTLARVKPAGQPTKPLDNELKEGPIIRGVLFFRDLSSSDCRWISELFFDAHKFIGEKAMFIKDNENVAIDRFCLGDHLKQMSEFLRRCAIDNVGVWSDF